MGTTLFGVDIAGIVDQVVSPGLPSVSLVKTTTTARTPGSLTAGTSSTPTTHTGRGFEETLAPGQSLADGSTVREATRVVSITGDSISPAAVPEAGDRVTSSVGGPYTIARVVSDPAQALYQCVVDA